MKINRLAVGGILSAMLAGAHAGLVTQTFNYGPKTPNYSGSATFNQYSGGSETLTQVVVRATLTADNYQIIADNDGGIPTSGFAYLGTRNITTLSAMNEARTLVTTNRFAFSLSADDGDGLGVQTNGTDWAEFSANGLETVWTKTYKSALDGFVGSGLYTWKYQVESYYNVQGSPSLLINTGTSGGQLQITYYTTIPEPATFAILAISGAVFVVRRRRLYRLPG